MNAWRAISRRPVRFSVTLCLAIVLVVLEENLFETIFMPSMKAAFDFSYTGDALFALSTIRRVLFGSIAVPVALVVTKAIWKAFGLQP